MKKLIALIQHAPKRASAILAMIAVAVIAPLALNAWGPYRDTFTIEKPASYVVFNSITNNPNLSDEPNKGDERNFVGSRESGTNSKWSDTMTVTEGKEYTVRMYVHNNAASNLNLTAENVTAKFNLPTDTAKSIQVNGFLSASNIGANTSGNKGSFGEVYDHATFQSDKNFNLAVVDGSIKYENNKGTFNLPESIFTSTGAKLGYESMNGKIPGCFEYAGYVTFKVKPQVQKTTNFTLDKKVSKHGENKWVENYKAQPGEVVDFVLQYKNTGEVQHDDVTFRDALPTGLSYVAGSTKWGNSRGTYDVTDNDGKLTNGTGINVGSYLPSAGAWIIFSAKVTDKTTQLPECGANTLKNVAKVTTGGYSTSDDAMVTVDKECQSEPKYTCDNLTVKKLERTKFEFSTAYTVKDATFKQVEYVVRNASGVEVYRGTNNIFSTETTGKYSVQSYVTVTVNGTDKTVTSNLCKKEFEVVKEKVPGVDIDKKVDGVEHKTVTVNQVFTYQLVVTNTGDVDLTNVKVTDNAPAHVQFISADKGTITNNKWSYTIPELKIGESVNINITAKVTKEVAGTIKNTACVDAPQVPGNPDDCDDATVDVKIKVCELATKKIITIKKNDFDASKHSSNFNDCAETPVPPHELPTTGVSDGLSALLGLGSLVASVSYYIASRRSLGL